MKNTLQRKAIISVFEDAGRPLNATEIHQHAIKHVKKIGIATIYRAIKNLVEENVIVPATIPGESPYYEMAGMHHHHHFKCNSCGIVLDIDDCLIDEAKIKKLATKHSFKLTDHNITLFGKCENCR